MVNDKFSNKVELCTQVLLCANIVFNILSNLCTSQGEAGQNDCRLIFDNARYSYGSLIYESYCQRLDEIVQFIKIIMYQNVIL